MRLQRGSEQGLGGYAQSREEKSSSANSAPGLLAQVPLLFYRACFRELSAPAFSRAH
jgi:hypothetical protein